MTTGIGRRQFISALGGAAVVWPLAAQAQQSAQPIVGFLHGASAAGYAKETEAFKQGLAEVGYIEGQNLTIEFRWADGDYDRLPELVADLLQRQVTVISAGAAPAVVVAKRATKTVPIVFELGADPVRLGFISSLNRPGGNITGIVNLSNGLVAKRVELMHQTVPNADPISVLLNPNNPNYNFAAADMAAAQTQIGTGIELLKARNTSELDASFAEVHGHRIGALVVGADPYFNSQRDQMAAMAASYGVPAVHELREFVRAGGLMSYGASLADAYRLAGVYVGRVLKGEKPAELPVQQSTKVEMSINLRAAKALGLTVPLPLLGRADEVIE